MKIKFRKIYIFEVSEHESYNNCCQLLKACHIDFVSYSALDDNDNRIFCIQLEGE